MTTENPIVYLIQEPTTEKDLSSAAQYGKIVPILASSDKPSQSPEKSLETLWNSLQNYRPAIDYICFAGGDPLAEFLAGIVLERLAFENITRLVWNRIRDSSGVRSGTGFYMPKIIKLV